MKYIVENSDEMKKIDFLIKKYGIDKKNIDTASKVPAVDIVEFRNHRSFETTEEQLRFDYNWDLISIWTRHTNINDMPTLEIHVKFKEFVFVLSGPERDFQLFLYKED